MTKNPPEKRKHHPGLDLIKAQERALLAQLDAIRESRKPEVIGAFFEDAFRDFVKQLLPASVNVTPGFILDTDGNKSSHFDALLVDTAYPYLGHLGIHKYVAMPAVLSAIELTTSMNQDKLISTIKKAEEIHNLSKQMFPTETWGEMGFYAVTVDAHMTIEQITRIYDEHKPICNLITLNPPSGSEFPIHCWMEGGKGGQVSSFPTKLALSDIVFMILQDSLYTLGSRSSTPNEVGSLLNFYISWGTVTPTSPS
jgi:hypothetical protein